MSLGENPKLQENQVLIKVAYAPVEEVDKATMNIKQEEKADNKTIGAEGCGTIEECGPGVDKSLKGKKVAFCYGGWS